MELVIFRHGPAEPRGGDKPDADRALTADGRRKTLLAAQGLARVVDRPGVILSSPNKRAHQTACLLSEVFDLPVEVEASLAHDEVRPIEAMLRRRDEAALAIVGHEPTLSRLVGKMLGIPPRDGELQLKKAGALVLHAPRHPHDVPGPARLEMLLQPRALRMLAGENNA